jgi:putative Holliday junction resolvase
VRVLAVDTGERRVGLALSDPTGTVAQPLAVAVLGRKDRMEDVVAQAARRYGAEAVVIGLPRHMNGSEGVGAVRARMLAETLRSMLGVPVDLWDERLTTVAAHRILREAGVSGRRRRETVDKTAAALILEGYLEARRGPGGPNRLAP